MPGTETKPLSERINPNSRRPPKSVAQIIAVKEASAPPFPQGRRDHHWPPQRGPPELTRILRKNELLAYVGLKKSQPSELIASGQFPSPIPLTDTGRAVGWLESEVADWQQSRIAVRDSKAARETAAAP
jgi:prophage regulatory protein